MAKKYRERIPEIVVDVKLWDPVNGFQHVNVTPSGSASDGVALGMIHVGDGTVIGPFRAPHFIVAYPTMPGQKTQYLVLESLDEVEAKFEAVEDPTPIPALPSGKKGKSE